MDSPDQRTPYEFLPRFERGPRGNTTERVERALRAAIVRLDFAPGEFIDKPAVCERLGVSRFPVSEALGHLAVEGLVEVLPQRGTRAARIRLPDVVEAMLIRRALEGMVAERATRSLSVATLSALEANLAAQEEALRSPDPAGFHTLDLALHETLVVALDLKRVAAVIESSRANVDRVRRMLSSTHRLAVTLEEHRAIVAAIAARRPDAARRAMEAHLDAVLDELQRFSTEHPEAFVDG
jgi:GntR family transcriptional regulator, rspAB operon transcriptional repressor